MADYDKLVDRYMRQIRSKNVDRRREAAMMLGELGVAEGITLLKDAYENDPDKQVRANAKYSLGMFRAFQEAIDEGRDEEVEELLTPILEEGEIGKRLSVPASRLWGVFGGLTALFVLLLAANAGVFLLGGGEGGGGIDIAALLGGNRTPRPTEVPNTAPDQDPQVIVNDARTLLGVLNGNAQTLVTQYEPTLGGAPPAECTAFYDVSAQAVEMSTNDRRANAELAAIVDELNTALETLTAAKTRVDQACFDEIPLEGDEPQQNYNLASSFVSRVPELENRLDTAVVPPDEPTAVPPTAGPTPEPTVAVTPEELLFATRPIVGELSDIIDRTTGLIGPQTVLRGFWEEAQANNGITDGCRAARPDIIEDYQLPAGIVTLESVSTDAFRLVQATNQVNTGLDLVRQGWDQFQAACASNTVGAAAAEGLTLAGVADASFTAARDTLSTVEIRD